MNKQMIRCVAVYPEEANEKFREKLRDYLHLAKKYHVEEVFTTIHLPEMTIEDQIDTLEMIADEAEAAGMELTVDIGGPFIKQVLKSKQILQRLNCLKISFLRMDYGYTFEQLKQLYHCLDIKGFVINASMFDEQKIKEHLTLFKSIDSDIEIKACHNFYVREESGLDDEFAKNQSAWFEKEDIPVYYCVPCHDHPRGPLYQGLTTLEKHRKWPLDLITLDLMVHFHAKAMMFSDPWMSEESFRKIDDVIQGKPVPVSVKLDQQITPEETQIVLKNHIFRYDSNCSFLRSRSSREMAEFASVVSAKEKTERVRGAITIDNEYYKRYSGELQVVLQDAAEDERVNVVGCVANEIELKKLEFFREGIEYKFIKEE